MKHIIYIACIALLCVACKSQKLINGNEELMFVPCAAIVSEPTMLAMASMILLSNRVGFLFVLISFIVI